MMEKNEQSDSTVARRVSKSCKGFSGQRSYITGFPFTHLVIQTGIGHHMSPVLDSLWGDNLCSTEDGDDTATDSDYRVGKGWVDGTQWQAAPNLQKQIR